MQHFERAVSVPGSDNFVPRIGEVFDGELAQQRLILSQENSGHCHPLFRSPSLVRKRGPVGKAAATRAT
ncbi:hypothetical protein GCM10011515_03860 [Tsuneonella deserti]|uniref:Uncharacterized protein n=1 Tax=Tsuneonella deserti TaxID=2035528 RepID=A0ABQ1S2L7_9SPHN|nr:hypothetical protein GCM10011515_03860 [Tsuneonella deserti]